MTTALLITVTDGSENSHRHLHHLLAGLSEQDFAVDLVLVMRGGGTPPASPGASVQIHPLPARLELSLSAARNAALEHAQTAGLLARATVVGFPDDDCRYPPGVLPAVARHVGAGSHLICGAYGPEPDRVDRRRFPALTCPLTPRLVMQCASSNDMFLSAEAVRRLGRFDEQLGLGATYGAAEDSDYLLRGLTLGFPGVYAGDQIVVEHPYKSHRPAQYYVGNVAVLAKHARESFRVRWLLTRRLVHGAVLVVRRAIPLREYVLALDAARRMAMGASSRPR